MHLLLAFFLCALFYIQYVQYTEYTYKPGHQPNIRSLTPFAQRKSTASLFLGSILKFCNL